MGFMDELKKLTRPYAEDEDDFDEDFDLDERPRASRGSSAPRAARASAQAYDEVLDDLSSSRPVASSPPPFHGQQGCQHLRSDADAGGSGEARPL